MGVNVTHIKQDLCVSKYVYLKLLEWIVYGLFAALYDAELQFQSTKV